jgi:hypothetical protein
MEQYVRDARIAQIYEGTNGVQAMDLVGRKLGMGGGAVVEGFFSMIDADLDAASAPRARAVADATHDALALLRDLTTSLRGAGPSATGAAAVDYLRLFALVSLGWMWTRMATASSAEPTPFHAAKLNVAEFFAQRMLPQARGLAAAIAAGDGSVMALAPDAF